MVALALALAELRRMPRGGDAISVHGYRFVVTKADQRRVLEVTIEQVEEVATPDPSSAPSGADEPGAPA